MSGATNEVRVIDDDDSIAGNVVRNYLDHEPELSARLAETRIPVVVFAPADVRYDTELTPGYFERVQAALTAAVANHGRGLYVASVHAGPLVRAPKPLPRLEGAGGAFVGYFAVGEGGAVFIQPSGTLGSDPALFDKAISAMMARQR